MSLDPVAKEVWCEALRSGEFKQGRGRLHDEFTDTYCCLGVACAIFPALTEVNEDRRSTFSDDVLELLGMEWDWERVLIELNDDFCNSFDEIADYIEQNL